MKRNLKTNPQLINLISALKEKSREKSVSLWRDIALRLERPSRNYSEINLSKINRHTKENEQLIVPGKVLGSGVLGHQLTVAALRFSGGAREKITSAGGKCLSIEELMDINPEGTGIRIVG